MESDKIHGVGVLHVLGILLREDHLRRSGGNRVPYGAVCAVSPTGLGQRAVEHSLKLICLRMLAAKQHRSPRRTHGVGAGGACTYFINITDGFQIIHPFSYCQMDYSILAPQRQGGYAEKGGALHPASKLSYALYASCRMKASKPASFRRCTIFSALARLANAPTCTR